MKTLKIAIALLAVVLVANAMFQVSKPAPPLATLMPEGPMLYVEAKDFGSILRDWNSSAEKQEWIKSDTLSVFSRSRLYLRLKDAQDQFAEVAGASPDMNLLGDSAGTETAFAWYDIGKLEFLYVSRVGSTKAMQNALWQSRAKFETRQAGSQQFYVRRNPQTQREVAFALVDDYLVIGTKEDLVAGSLSLISGQPGRNLQGEEWFTKAIASAGEQGDLRMVLNMTKVVPSSYFRTYWIQQNITNLKQYSAAICDLHRGAQQYREDRVLLRKAEDTSLWTAVSAEDSRALPELAKLAGEDAGFYRVTARPEVPIVLDAMVAKVLSPHLGAAPVQKIAPRVSLGGGETGSESDLETRIDEPPAVRTASEESTTALRQLLEKNAARGMLTLHGTSRSGDGFFVNLNSTVAVLGTSDWDEAEVRNAIGAVLRPGMTVSQLGAGWRSVQDGSSRFAQLDGLASIAFGTHGKLLVLGNDPKAVAAVLQRADSPAKDGAESYVAGFRHGQERQNYLRLVQAVDRNIEPIASSPGSDREPQFFSENIASLSRMFQALSMERIVEHDEGARVLQTVTYEWSH